jgi:hypothetical protein
MTTLLCNLLMCLSKTGFVIRYYGYMFILIVFICLLNGLFLFPVMLSLVGPSNAANLGAVNPAGAQPTKTIHVENPEPTKTIQVGGATVTPVEPTTSDESDPGTPVKPFSA